MSTPPATDGAVGAPAIVPVVAPALPSPIGLHGVIVAFDSTQEQWDEYTERLQHYFTANDIVTEDKRRAILLNAQSERPLTV